MAIIYKRVLIIDDDEISNFISQKLLEQCQISNDIISYDNARGALKFLKDCVLTGQTLPDLILLDINMPLMNGWEFLKQLEELADIKKSNTSLYILSSSLYSKDFDIAARNELVNGYIVKPLSREKIMEISKIDNLQKSTV